MGTFSEVQITFNSDLADTDTVNFKDTFGVTFNYLETYVPVRSAANEVTVGVPTATPGEISAINYVISFNLDYNTLSNYDVSRVLNVVTIKAIDFNATFSVSPHSGDVSFLFTNVIIPIYNRINARSPYFITAPIYDDPSLVVPEKADFDIFIWEGDFVTDKPSTPQYTYQKKPRFLNDNVLYINVSDQINDFINNSFNGTYGGKSVFVQTEITTTHSGGTLDSIETNIAFSGYGNHSEGVNPSPDDDLMINNEFISINRGEDLRLPFYKAGDDYTIEFRQGLSVIDTQNIVSQSVDDTADFIEVISYSNIDNINNIRVQNTTQATEVILDLEVVDECIYDPIKVTFINKNGVLQDLWCYKVNKESLKVKDNTYKSNKLTESIVNNAALLSYNTNDHQKKRFNVTGDKSITLNTGYLNEDNNDLVEEMMLSENIWITKDSVILPVNITSKSLSYMTKRNDQLIKYDFKFDYSFDEIQNMQ